MSNYNKQYQAEAALFGPSYSEFVTFVKEHAHDGGRALDLGCGQGRDALMLAQHSYDVTGVDASRVGIEQMRAQASAENLPVHGVVTDIYGYKPKGRYDAIVLDSILHFEKTDKAKELDLLNKLPAYLNNQGYLLIFVHKSAKKEKELLSWFESVQVVFTLVQDGYVNAIYEEKKSDFRTEFQMYSFNLQGKGAGLK
jgi:cyclopropane fatty-acyl-phospholipid synthase-like methyltransferase